MLDGLRSGQRGAAHALQSDGVDGHGNSGAPGGFDRQLHLVERESGMRAWIRTPAVIAIEFDPIRAMPDLVAHDTDEAVYAVSLFSALRHAPLERKALGAVASGGDDRAGRSQDARTRNNSLLYRLLQFDVGISRAFSSEIANRGEAGQQRVAQVVDRASRAKRQPFLSYLIVPDGL